MFSTIQISEHKGFFCFRSCTCSSFFVFVEKRNLTVKWNFDQNLYTSKIDHSCTQFGTDFRGGTPGYHLKKLVFFYNLEHKNVKTAQFVRLYVILNAFGELFLHQYFGVGLNGLKCLEILRTLWIIT